MKLEQLQVIEKQLLLLEADWQNISYYMMYVHCIKNPVKMKVLEQRYSDYPVFTLTHCSDYKGMNLPK